jgi:hypothetical protein
MPSSLLLVMIKEFFLEKMQEDIHSCVGHNIYIFSTLSIVFQNLPMFATEAPNWSNII